MHRSVLPNLLLVAVRFVWVLPLFLLLNACVFSLTEFYDNPVDKNPSPPGISVVKLDLEADTVVAYTGRTITFQFESDNQAIQGAKLLIDDVVIDSVESKSGQMSFNYWNVTDGIHKLTLKIFTASGTGSIMDKLGGESIVMERDWVLLMDASRSNNTRCKPENGYLRVEWDWYRSLDFAAYVLRLGDVPMAEFKTPGQTHFIDSSYVGEYGNYSVYIRLKDGSLLDWGYCYLQNSLPELKLRASIQNEYRICWNKFTYYNAIAKCTFELNSKVVSESANMDDTTFLLDLPFNQSFSFNLSVVPKHPRASYTSNPYQYRKYLYDLTGFRLNLPMISTNLQQIGPDRVAHKGVNAILEYQMSTNPHLVKQTPIRDNTVYGLTLSPTGKYAMGYYYNGTSTKQYVLKNLGTGAVNNVPNYDSFTGGISQEIVLSDVGTGVIYNLSGVETVLDYKTGTVLASNMPRQSFTNIKISPDGNYYAVNASDSLYLYALKNGQSGVRRVTAFDNRSNVMSYWEFDKVNPNYLYVVSNKRMIGYRCDQSVKVVDFALAEPVLSIDFFHREILCSSTNLFRLRSLTDGSLIEDIPVSFTPNPYGIHLLCNRFIIENASLAYKINGI